MESVLAAAETEQLVGTLSNAKLLRYLAIILRENHLRPLDVYGTLIEDGAQTLPPPQPAANDAFLVAEDEVVILEAALASREVLGWTRPGTCIILQIDGVRRARCLLDLPAAGAAGAEHATETIRVSSVRGTVPSLPLPPPRYLPLTGWCST
ncbi:hypothetical protein B0H16DRAFT_977901 [Mycena metata]|uniref:Uncharacterized protein n=1 Tax=Mycena metata TaxID=1033252 RepID=A0AAD7IKM3_9AGAR|nr:hypothetical protein B0H16DRAFT_977901 [Mycena metata]